MIGRYKAEMTMKTINGGLFEGERALFASKGLHIDGAIFANGESPLKESANLELAACMFKWKYPLWYCNGVEVSDSAFFEMARAGIWYTNNISVKNTVIEAPKAFRRCTGVKLDGVQFTNAAETLWSCRDIDMKNVTARGDYFAMNCEGMEIDGLTLVGNYSFDGAKNVKIRNSKLLSKDAFWNADNVEVYDSFISGEYLGWNARRLTLVNCTIESLQGLCYVGELTMRGCRMPGTTLAFEYSQVDADIIGDIPSVIDPAGGRITADSIGELIINADRVDPTATKIVCRKDGGERAR